MHCFVPIFNPTMTFRFFDLPPEIRLKIYSEVLEIRTNSLGERDSIFCPQLLRANKQCQAEGEAILNGKNEMTIDIESELHAIGPDDVYHDTVKIIVGGRRIAQGGTRASLGFLVCMAASWPEYVRKARKLRVNLYAYDMRDGTGMEGLLWSLAFPRLQAEAIYSLSRYGGDFAPLSQLVTSLAQAATRCRELRVKSSFSNLLTGSTTLQVDRALKGMAAFANVTKCEVETIGEPSGGVSLRALILGPVPTREELSTTSISDAVRETQSSLAFGSPEAGYGIPAVLPGGSYQVANVDDEAELDGDDTPDLSYDSDNVLQPLLALREVSGPGELVLWSAI